MSFQPTDQVMMIRPVHFRYNEETAKDNEFQIESDVPKEATQSVAAQEFDQLVNNLQQAGVVVLVIPDNSEKDTPDSIFPNNWISTHSTGEVIIYPMYAENRRDEVRMDIVEKLVEEFGFTKVINWTDCVENDLFLEGTGSFVLDRENQIAYACLSERTNLELANKWAVEMDYDLVYFNAVDEDINPIYHTNVMMAVAKNYVIICLDSIPDIAQREMVIEAIEESEKELIEISFEQMLHFAGNMIELASKEEKSILVMSQAAYDSLYEEQIEQIESYSTILSSAIPTIEKNGGGSVRCMIAEIFAPKG